VKAVENEPRMVGSRWRASRRAALLAALAVALPAPRLSAEPDPAIPRRTPYTPAEAKRERIKLNDAIQLTLENAPAMRRARAEAERRRGAVMEASGIFDPKIVFAPTYTRAIGFVIGGTLKTEQDKRELLRILDFEFSLVAADIQKNAELNLGLALPPCRGFDLGGFTDLNTATSTTPFAGRITVRGDGFSAFLNNGQLVAAVVNGQLICLPSRSGTQANIAQAQRDTQAILRRTDPNAPSSNDDALTAQLLRLADAFRDIAARSRQASANLGPLPSRDVRDVFGIDLQVPIPFRNGFVVAPLLQFAGTRDMFLGKPFSAGFGGKGIPTQFTSVIGLSLTAPLGEGSFLSVAAPERGAELNYAAALEDEAQAAAVSVRDTVLAYWELAAAQDRVALFDRSIVLQGQVEQLSGGLIEAGEIPRVEIDRVHARTADLRSQVAGARQALVQARVALARAMGTTLSDLDAAPLAEDPLPDPPGIPKIDLPALVQASTKARSDIRAQVRREEAADVFLRAARWDIKPRMDLVLQADYRGLYERNDMHPLYLKGYWYALTGSTRGAKVASGPSVSVNFRLSFPFALNAARGRFVQSEALYDQSVINRRNLERIVQSRTVETVNSVIRSAEEVQARKDANLRYDETIKSSFELYRAGESSLLDSILTERDLTGAQVEAVNARLTYANRMTQLRYEAGALLRYSSQGGVLTIQEVTPVGFSFFKYD